MKLSKALLLAASAAAAVGTAVYAKRKLEQSENPLKKEISKTQWKSTGEYTEKSVIKSKVSEQKQIEIIKEKIAEAQSSLLPVPEETAVEPAYEKYEPVDFMFAEDDSDRVDFEDVFAHFKKLEKPVSKKSDCEIEKVEEIVNKAEQTEIVPETEGGDISVSETTPEVEEVAELVPEVEEVAELVPEAEEVAETTPEVEEVAETVSEVEEVAETTPEVEKVEEPVSEVEEVEEPVPEAEEVEEPVPEAEEVEEPVPEAEEVAETVSEVEEVAETTPEVEEVAEPVSEVEEVEEPVPEAEEVEKTVPEAEEVEEIAPEAEEVEEPVPEAEEIAETAPEVEEAAEAVTVEETDSRPVSDVDEPVFLDDIVGDSPVDDVFGDLTAQINAIEEAAAAENESVEKTVDFFDLPDEPYEEPVSTDSENEEVSVEDLFGHLLSEDDNKPEPVISSPNEVFSMFENEKHDDFDSYNDEKIEAESEKQKTTDTRRLIAQDIADNITTFAPLLESLNAVKENKIRSKSGIIFDWEMRIQSLLGDLPIKAYWRRNFNNYEIWTDEKYMEKAGELLSMLELVGIMRDKAKEVVFEPDTLDFYSAQSEILNNDFRIGETVVVIRPCWKIDGKPARKGEIAKKAPFAEFSHKKISLLEQMLRANRCENGEVSIPVTEDNFCSFDRDIPYIRQAIRSGSCRCAVRRMDDGGALAFFYEIVADGESAHYSPCTLRFEITIDKNGRLLGRFKAEKV